MAKLPNNFDSTYHQSPDTTPNGSDEEDIPTPTPRVTPRVTQTVAHPYMLGKVRRAELAAT